MTKKSVLVAKEPPRELPFALLVLANTSSKKEAWYQVDRTLGHSHLSAIVQPAEQPQPTTEDKQRTIEESREVARANMRQQ